MSSESPAEAVVAIRNAIDQLDDHLLSVLAERYTLARAIGRIKAEHGYRGPDPAREAEIIGRLAEEGTLRGDHVAEIWGAIFSVSHRLQATDRGE